MPNKETCVYNIYIYIYIYAICITGITEVSKRCVPWQRRPRFGWRTKHNPQAEDPVLSLEKLPKAGVRCRGVHATWQVTAIAIRRLTPVAPVVATVVT